MIETAKPISVVIVGFGLGGRIFHGPLVGATAGLSVGGIVTSNPDRQAQARAAYPAAAIYTTADEAWHGGHELAAISTANITHKEYAAAALDAGMHVVLDKPLVPTAADAVALGELAATKARLLIPFQNRRWDSDFLTARAVASSGSLGTVHRFESRIARMRMSLSGAWRESTNPSDMGGALWDLGPHVIDQALQLMGPVTSVFASARSVRSAGGMDDDDTVVLTHGSGAISTLVTSLIAAFGEPRFTLFGTEGGLRIDASDSQEDALVAGRLPEPGVLWGVEPPGTEAILRTFAPDRTPTQALVPLERGAWPVFYAAVERAIRGEGAPPVPLDDAIADLRVIEAAHESAADRSVVTLNPPAAHRA